MVGKLKYITALLLVFMVSFVGGCVGVDAKTAEAYEPEILEKVYTTNDGVIMGFDSCIWRDTRTGVNYLVTHDGGTCVMVDAEGKPLVDKGE